MKLGIDIIELDKLKEQIDGNPAFIDHLLVERECENWELATLAGKIAAKEAIIKTGFIKAGQWHKLQVLSSKSGAPVVNDENGEKIDDLQVSISHTENFAVAVAIYEKD